MALLFPHRHALAGRTLTPVSALAGLAPALALAVAACGGTDDPAVDDPPPTEDAPVYALVTSVFTDTGSATYVNLVDTLDITSIDLAQAREFPGFAPFAASDGHLYIGNGEAPEVTKYAIADDGSWQSRGTVSFSNHVSAGAVSSVVVDGDSAYAPLDVLGRVVWDPTAMAIRGPADAPAAVPLEREGRQANLGYNHPLRGDRLYQPVYWADASYDTYTQTSQVIVYDTSTDEVATVLDTACPHLHIASQDRAGNLYLSNGSLSGTMVLFDETAPRNCVVRIPAGQDAIDPSWSLTFADVTDGREGAGFRILDDATAFFAVFHHENVEVTPQTDPKSVNYSANWRLWTMDLATRQARPLDAIPPFAGQYLAYRFGDRTFLGIPAADYASTTTYELLADGSVVERFVTAGWTYEWVAVR